MNATLIAAPAPSDRALIDAEWGPGRRAAVDEATLDRRDAALAWTEDN